MKTTTEPKGLAPHAVPLPELLDEPEEVYPKVIRRGRYLVVEDGREYRIPKDPIFVLGLVQHLAKKGWPTMSAEWLANAIDRIAAARGWQIHPWPRRFRMNSRACIAAVALVLAGTQGQTIFRDGNALVEEMRQFEQSERNAPHKELGTGIYMGYVIGVADASSGITWCPGGAGNRVTVGQVTSTVSQYMNNNPDKWHLEAAALVVNALQQAFPCKK